MHPSLSLLPAVFLFLSTDSFLPFPPLSFLSLILSYAKFLRTLVAERERVYRSIAERPRSRLLLLLEVRSRRAGFFLPPSIPSARFSLLFLATRCGSVRTASLRRHDVPRPLPVVDSPVRVSLTSRVPRE